MFGWFSDGQHLRFALEPRETLGILRERVGQDLERDVAVELGIARTIDFAHAACAQEREDFIRAEVGPGGQRHARARRF